MVILWGLPILLAGSALAVQDEFLPQMVDPKLPSIASVAIIENGARAPSAAGMQVECGSFQLSATEIVRFLRDAREVTQHNYLHMLDWSPCFASGKVTFSNGMTGTWGIQQLRAGSLKLSNGRMLYLYCPHCRGRAFLPATADQP